METNINSEITMSKPYFKNEYYIGNIPILPKHILDPLSVNDKFNWEELKEANNSLNEEKYPQMLEYAEFINSEKASREAKYLVGSGPYLFDKWIPESSITLKRNENYWNKKEIPSYPHKLVFKTIQDQNTAVTSAMNNNLDFMFVIQPNVFVEDLKNPEKYNLKKALVSEPVYSFIAWNNNHPIFSDKKVRWALSYAIDRQAIIDSINFGLGVPIQSHVFLKSKSINTDLLAIPYNPEKAKILLSEAGWKDTDSDGILDKVINNIKTDFNFTFTNNNNPKRKKFLLAIIDHLKKIGIQSDIQENEWSVFLDKVSNHNFDACYSAWQVEVSNEDPYQIWHSSTSQANASNFISYFNPESDALLEQIQLEFNEYKRIQLLKKWQEIIYDDQPVTFL